MKSPFTGGNAIRKTTTEKAKYRGKEYTYHYTRYVCVDTNEEFTTTEMDEENISQIYDQYRRENGIPFPDEIKQLRKHFGLSTTAMSTLFGFGENQYRLYEAGEVPSLSNGRAIRVVINHPSILMDYAESARGTLDKNKYTKISNKIKSAEAQQYAR